MSNKLGIPSSNNFVPLQSSTKRTKQVALTFSATPAGWSLSRAVGVAYADSNNVWRLRFNIVAAVTNSGTATITGVVFKTTGVIQCVTCSLSSNSLTGLAYVGNGNGDVVVSSAGTNTNFIVSGDVELDSEPTWAAALESPIAVDVYIPSASAGVSGLVDNSASNTAGTPIKGRTSGLAASGDVGEILTTTVRPGTGGDGYSDYNNTNITNSFTAVISKTLNKGVYMVLADTRCYKVEATLAELQAYLAIGGSAVTNTSASELTGAATTTHVSTVINITINSTVVALYAKLSSGTAGAPVNELSIVRIA